MTSLDQLLSNTLRNIKFSEAQRLILDQAPKVRSESVKIHSATNRTLAKGLVAKRDSPAGAVSAMDGYALRHADLSSDLIVRGQTKAGESAGVSLERGAACRVFTGALLPKGADTVLVQEDANVSNGRLVPKSLPKFGAFVRPKGFDFQRGEELLSSGQKLTPAAIALCAAANVDRIEIARKPRIAIISTGNELCEPGMAKNSEDVVSSNGLALSALLENAGAESSNMGLVGDNVAELSKILHSAKNHDLIITTGGASVGDYDLVQTALQALGGKPTFWQVMVRPGKPVFLWELQGTPVLGLPGNPVSALVCGRVFAMPWVRRALGQNPEIERTIPFQLAKEIKQNGPRHQFARAILKDGLALITESQDSSLIKTLHRANLLIERPPHDKARAKGEIVQCLVLQN
ncbi:MAG: gephyrin-like molybdotransferase Glp [Alphaproteobacteria bacterium]